MKKLIGALVILTTGFASEAARVVNVNAPPVDKIAYISTFPPTSLAIMDADGSNRTPLSTGDAREPAWSPDGTRLAFTSGSNLFVVPAAGGTPVALVNWDDYLDGAAPEWSPDGTKIAFTNDGRIFVVTVAGGALVDLTDGRQPAWSPAGTKIAFSSSRDSELYVINADGSNLARLTTGVSAGGHPSWSPDGTHIVFTCIVDWAFPQSDVCAIGADGSGFLHLTTDPDHDSSPAWSPDGTRIAFITSRYGGWTNCPDDQATQLAVMNADGSGVSQLGGTSDEVVGRFRWSPDGSRIAFSNAWILYIDYGNGAGYSCSSLSSVFVVNADGTDLAYLDSGYSPAWRPAATGSTPSDVSEPPVASFLSTCGGLTCSFDASGSSDEDGTIASYAWTFGDATTGSGATVNRTYAAGGSYTVGLTVADNAAATNQTASVVNVNAPPVASFTSACSGLACSFNAFGSPDSDGTIASYAWNFGDGTTGSGATASHTYAAAGTYIVTLTATDDDDVTGTQTVSVQALAPVDPAVEQIALIRLYDCYVGAYSDYPPPCQESVLMDVNGSHVIPMPLGAWSPDGTRLLVERVGTQNDAEIHVMAATGGPSTNLTNDPANDQSPAWSPDGTRIAFASDRDGPLDLYVMNADGSDVVRIGTGVGRAWGPTWSPDTDTDSARLAFTCIVDPVSSPWWSAPTNLDICAINADGSGFERLTSEPGSDSDPDWSPDGARILFVTDRYGTELVVMNPDGSDVTRVSPGIPGNSPSWSSDGTRIVFVYLLPIDWDALWMPVSFVSVINADGTGFTDLGWGYSPVWRPWAGGLNDRPVASFTVECSGLTCTFDGSPSSDFDGPIASFGWQFGDGTTSSDATATHTFAGGHTYGVRLLVMDDDGALGTSVQSLDLNQPPVVSFTTTCSGLTCTFDRSASFDDGTISFFRYDFGDRIDSHAPATMTHTYAAAGTYIVTLTATDNEYRRGTQTQTVTVVNVNAPPVASFTSTCSGLMCSFNATASSDLDGTITGYAWNLGDTTTGSGATASRTYAAGGAYTVTLTVTDNGAATSTQALSVTVVPPEVHVGDLDRARTMQQYTWTATVTITVHDSSHGLVANAVVSGYWNGGSTSSCTTNGSGQCKVSRSGILKKTTSVSFTVTNVAWATFVYKPTDNHDPDGDSNGISVTVSKP